VFVSITTESFDVETLHCASPEGLGDKVFEPKSLGGRKGKECNSGYVSFGCCVVTDYDAVLHVARPGRVHLRKVVTRHGHESEVASCFGVVVHEGIGTEGEIGGIV